MGISNQKLTYDFVKQQFTAHGCTLLEKEYVNANTPIRYICSCGHESKITYGNFSVGKRCMRCRGQKSAAAFKLSHIDVDAYFTKNNCQLLDVYVNNRTPMRYVCCCGRKARISFDNFQKGKRCRRCGVQKRTGLSKFTHEEVAKYFSDHGCKLLDHYTNTRTLVNYICACGHESQTTYNRFKLGKRCKHCRQSIGEQMIEHHLKSAGCKFTREYKHPTCKNMRSLSFDFAVETSQGLMLIEYQGRQHYEPVNFGSKKYDYLHEFRETQKRDNVKRKWCQHNCIQLLEIPYYEFKNIEQILGKFIHHRDDSCVG